MFLLRKRKMILNFGKMLDIMPKFDIITVAFQRQQVGETPSSPANGPFITRIFSPGANGDVLIQIVSSE